MENERGRSVTKLSRKSVVGTTILLASAGGALLLHTEAKSASLSENNPTPEWPTKTSTSTEPMPTTCTPTPRPTKTPTETEMPTKTILPTETPKLTRTPTRTQEATKTSLPTRTPEAVVIDISGPTTPGTPTSTSTPIETPVNTLTPTSTVTDTPSPTNTITKTPTQTENVIFTSTATQEEITTSKNKKTTPKPAGTPGGGKPLYTNRLPENGELVGKPYSNNRTRNTAAGGLTMFGYILTGGAIFEASKRNFRGNKASKPTR